MNILILISSLSYGGAEKQAVIDAELLSKKHNVIIGTFFDGPLKKNFTSHFKHIRIKKDNYIFTTFRIIRIIKANNIDVISASLFASMVMGALAAFIGRIPVFWHFHSHEYDIPRTHKIILQLLSKLPNVKKMLYVNNELKDYFIDKVNFPEHKAGILYNSSLIKYPRTNNRKENGKINIGYVGRIIELKRIPYLVELAEYLMKNNLNFIIHIVGDGPERVKVEKYAKDLNVHDYIKFWGFQNETEKFYDFFDIFVLPSREECLSIALIDASIKGIPSIAFKIGGNDEIVINGNTGFIVSDKEEMFEKVKLLISDPRLREKMGNEAREFALKNFGEEAHIAKLTDLYEEII